MFWSITTFRNHRELLLRIGLAHGGKGKKELRNAQCYHRNPRPALIHTLRSAVPHRSWTRNAGVRCGLPLLCSNPPTIYDFSRARSVITVVTGLAPLKAFAIFGSSSATPPSGSGTVLLYSHRYCIVNWLIIDTVL